MIKVCQKCLRIKLNDTAPWSPRPSPQAASMPKSKLEPVEECDYCDGTIQEEPEEKVRKTKKEVASDKSGEAERNVGELHNKGNDADVGKPEPDIEHDKALKNENEQRPQDAPESNEEPDKVQDTRVEVTIEKPTKIVAHNRKTAATDDEKLAVVANKHHQALVECKKLMGQSMIEFCRHLREIKEKELFRFYANSWYEYLSMPEIGMDDTRARRLIRLINVKDAMEKQLGRDVNFDEIAEARLTRDLLPCINYDEEKGEIKNIKSAEELLDQARTLGHEDWQAEVEKKKPRVAGRKAAEVLIEAPSPVTDDKNNVIGQLVSVSANDENHYLRIRIANENIVDGPLTIRIS